MNYFGHVAVASWSTSEPGALLGAMLPDFASMCRARLADAQVDAAVARGIALHHAADAHFHRLPVVTALMRELDAHLAAGGCARGPRRAVAHIGTELMLDGVYVAEPEFRAAYLAAITVDPARVAFEPQASFELLMTRLRGYGCPDDLREIDSIVARLARILGPRPLLAPSHEDLRAIRAGLAAHRARVAVVADTILHAMRGASSTRNA